MKTEQEAVGIKTRQEETNRTQESQSVFDLPKERLVSYAILFGLIQLGYHAATGVPFDLPYAVVTLVGGFLAAPLLGVLSSNLPVRLGARLGLVWICLFIVQMFADLIEGAFFTTQISTPTIFLAGTIISLAITLAESVGAVSLFRSNSRNVSLRSTLTPYFTQSRWLLRLGVGSVAYFPIYFTFGAIVSPIVIPYYTNPSLGLGLQIPGFSVIIPIEILRGILFVLALVPIIVTIKLARRDTFLLVALLLYVLGAYVPFVAGSTLPMTLKIVHSLEILADSLVFGAVLTYLFRPKLIDTLHHSLARD